MSIVPSGRPAPCHRLVISWPSIVPTVRLTLRIGRSIVDVARRRRSPAGRGGSARRRARRRGRGPGRRDCSSVWPYGFCGTARIGLMSRPGGLPVVDRRLACRAPRRGRSSPPSCGSRAAAISSRTSSAMYSKKFSTNSGLPLNRLRSSGFWVATPTGHVSRWQTRIITQPDTTSGAVAKPNSSAPSRAAITTSRPVFSWPSVCTTMRSRRPLSSSVCWVSARPSSHGPPACLSDVSGLAPVPPSWPEISTTSAFALLTPGGDGADARPRRRA